MAALVRAQSEKCIAVLDGKRGLARTPVLFDQAYPWDLVVLHAAQEDVESHRVHVEVVVAVDVIQG